MVRCRILRPGIGITGGQLMALNLGYNHTEEEAPLGVLVDVDCEVVG